MLKSILKDGGIPEKNIQVLSIKACVDEVIKTLKIEQSEENKLRIGNITARMRMIFLYDMAKKNNALVCGTENKSENLLGYFTRFGDQASDIEPIEHLFKTQVLQLASYLGIPEPVIVQKPTAGLWAGQTDESEFGFTYEEADLVLHLYFDKHFPVGEIEKMGLGNAEKIIDRAKRNEFKHKVPYRM
jgi:NAD+ synthase